MDFVRFSLGMLIVVQLLSIACINRSVTIEVAAAVISNEKLLDKLQRHARPWLDVVFCLVIQ